MANKLDNLIPFTSDQNREEAKINGRKGGIRSGEVRREKATFKKTLEMILDEPSKNGKTYREEATLGFIKGAMSGNPQNFKLMLEIMGELNQIEEDRKQKELSKVEELLMKIEDEANK